MLGKILVAVLALCVVKVYSFDDVTSLIKPFCSGEETTLLKRAEDCAENLPDIAKKCRDDCMQQVTGTTDRKEFLTRLCTDATRELQEKMRLCLFKKQDEITISSDDLEKVLEVVRCLRVVMHTSR